MRTERLVYKRAEIMLIEQSVATAKLHITRIGLPKDYIMVKLYLKSFILKSILTMHELIDFSRTRGYRSIFFDSLSLVKQNISLGKIYGKGVDKVEKSFFVIVFGKTLISDSTRINT